MLVFKVFLVVLGRGCVSCFFVDVFFFLFLNVFWLISMVFGVFV